MPEPTTRPTNLTLLQPENYAHSAAMAELAETLIVALDALRLPFQFNMNKIEPDCTNIVLGAHLLDAQTMRAIPADTILYNSEQISENPDENSTWITPAYLDLLKKCVVWDYSEENIRRMKNIGVEGAKFVPIGYVPQLTRIPADVAQDIDVLFYGAINERRRVILEGLIKKGLRIEFLVGVYREERDRMIARAKVVLNMHYYDAQVFEIVRVSYLLANEKPVVAECGAATAIEPDIRQAVRAVPYDALVDACAELVADNDARAKLARQGLEIFSKRNAPEILARALGVPAPL